MVPATPTAEAGGSLESGSLSPAWVMRGDPHLKTTTNISRATPGDALPLTRQSGKGEDAVGDRWGEKKALLSGRVQGKGSPRERNRVPVLEV